MIFILLVTVTGAKAVPEANAAATAIRKTVTAATAQTHSAGAAAAPAAVTTKGSAVLKLQSTRLLYDAIVNDD